MKILNLNVGLLGHVDSGKTSLAKVLSEVPSTASFDKDPQSQERGITLDLGFSSFSCPAPSHLSDSQCETLQFTLVDCPGHASLIKTVIGGSHIIDMMILVIDATKGIQTQTSECLIIGEITNKKMIVVLNKIDLLTDKKSAEKLQKKMRITLDATAFKGCPIVSASAINKDVNEVIQTLIDQAFIPERNVTKPFLFAVDHCFAIKGKGTVLTGTVLQGSVKINDDIEIPSIGSCKKVKSIQMFKKPVESAVQGDRVGICVTQFDPTTLERGIACQIHYVPMCHAAILKFNRVKYFKNSISSKANFHINVGYENVVAKICLFRSKSNNEGFDLKNEYEYIPVVDENADLTNTNLFVLLEFARPVLIIPNSLAIGARLDSSIHSNSCRLAFYGTISTSVESKNYQTDFLPNLKIYKEKYKKGIVERATNECEVIGKNMFKKETNIQKFINMKVSLSSGEEGILESTFGQSGKFKIRIPGGLKAATLDALNAKKDAKIEIILKHKRFIYDPNKKMMQT